MNIFPIRGRAQDLVTRIRLALVLKRVAIFLEFKKVLMILTDGGSNSGQVSGPAQTTEEFWCCDIQCGDRTEFIHAGIASYGFRSSESACYHFGQLLPTIVARWANVFADL